MISRLFRLLPLAVAVVACGCDSQQKQLRRGDKLLGQGDISGAVQAYRAASPSTDESIAAPALWALATIHRDQLSEPTAAEESCEELITRFPAAVFSDDCLELMANLREARQDWWGAIDARREQLARQPDHLRGEDIRHRIARCYFHQGDPQQAIVEWTDQLELYPDGRLAADALLGVARSHDLAGDCGLAIGVYQRVNSRFDGSPQAAMAIVGEAGCVEFQGDLDRAEALYTEALVLHPNPAAIQMRLDELRLSRGIRDPVVR